MIHIRPYREGDAEGVVRWWHERLPSLHLVAESDSRIIGHVQAADVGAENLRRVGEINMILQVDDWHGETPLLLLNQVLEFSAHQGANRLTSAFVGEEPKGGFLLQNGFVPFEQFHPLRLELDRFDPSQHQSHLDSTFKLFTYAEAGDSVENRQKLYDLERNARRDQPFRQVGPYSPPAFAQWESELETARHDTIFLAANGDEWVGVIRDLDWPFTGVHSSWRGRGIATALKVWALCVAKSEGLASVETENHEDNHSMRAVNLKLGYQPEPIETNCVRRMLLCIV